MQKHITETYLKLKELSLKNTKVRREIFQILSKASNPIDAPYLVEHIKVNKSSIYRELKVLVSKGVVIEIDFGEGKKRYDLATVNHHHHLVCTSCKSISEMKLKQDLDNIEKEIEKDTSFKVQRHNLEFFGLCANCR